MPTPLLIIAPFDVAMFLPNPTDPDAVPIFTIDAYALALRVLRYIQKRTVYDLGELNPLGDTLKGDTISNCLDSVDISATPEYPPNGSATAVVIDNPPRGIHSVFPVAS